MKKKKKEEEAVKGVLSVQPISNILYWSKMDSSYTPNLSDNIFLFTSPYSLSFQLGCCERQPVGRCH